MKNVPIRAMVFVVGVIAFGNVMAMEESSEQALFKAIKSGQIEKVQKLIIAGAKVNVQGNYQLTPLHVAAQNNNAAMVKILLDDGANVHARDVYGRTPVHQVTMNSKKSTEALEALLAAGAKANDISQEKKTPLHSAARFGCVQKVRVLLAAIVDKASVHEKPTPLKEAKNTFQLLCKVDTKKAEEWREAYELIFNLLEDTN